MKIRSLKPPEAKYFPGDSASADDPSPPSRVEIEKNPENVPKSRKKRPLHQGEAAFPRQLHVKSGKQPLPTGESDHDPGPDPCPNGGHDPNDGHDPSRNRDPGNSRPGQNPGVRSRRHTRIRIRRSSSAPESSTRHPRSRPSRSIPVLGKEGRNPDCGRPHKFQTGLPEPERSPNLPRLPLPPLPTSNSSCCP